MQLDAALLGLFGDPVKQVGETAIQQRSQILVCRAMSKELQEEIVADGGSQVEPMAYARGRWQIVAGDFTGLNARPYTVCKAQADRTGNHQEIASAAAADRSFDAMIEGTGTIVGVIGAPINLVDDAALRGRGKRGHGEIGVAAQVAEQGDFSVEAAAPAIGPRVVQRPVAMNESEDGAAVLLAEQAVIAGEPAAKLGDLVDEGIALLVVVMQMHLDITKAEANHFGEAFKKLAAVIFLGIEEAVLRALAGGVLRAGGGNARPAVTPTGQTGAGDLLGCAGAQRLEMIGDGNPCAPGFAAVHLLPKAVLQVRQQPDFRVSCKLHEFDLL